MSQIVFVGCKFKFNLKKLPPRSEWVGMKQGVSQLSGSPSDRSLRYYCNPDQGVVVSRDPETHLVCPSFAIGQNVYTTEAAWDAFMAARQKWRSKRRQPVG
jgi:hypothetical protein